MASRGHLGGLSWATPQALRVLDAAGFDVVLVETVGVGQAEVEIASLADSTLVLLAPGMGDAIQAAKAGILEVADVFVVNKADRDGAEQTYRELKQMLQLGSDQRHRRRLEAPGRCKTVAAQQRGRRRRRRRAREAPRLDGGRAASCSRRRQAARVRRDRGDRRRHPAGADGRPARRHALDDLAAAVVAGNSTRTRPPTGWSPGSPPTDRSAHDRARPAGAGRRNPAARVRPRARRARTSRPRRAVAAEPADRFPGTARRSAPVRSKDRPPAAARDRTTASPVPCRRSARPRAAFRVPAPGTSSGSD